MRSANLAAALVTLWAVSACSKARPVQGAPTDRTSWEEDVAPLFAARCSSCHSGPNAQAGYRTTSYLEALGPRAAPVAKAGEADSRLLQVIDPAHADAVHAPVAAAAFPVARAWVVDGRLSFFRSLVHEGGILNPANPDGEFHGAILENTAFNFDVCAGCHGTDFAGGKAQVSCLTCHPQGPTACDTCHGQPPATNAHLAHVLGPVGRPLDCSACHVKPAHFNDPGHLTTPDGKVKTKANVTFAAQSQAALPGPGRTGPPTYDPPTCSNIYCHGATLQNAGATHTVPSWTGGPAEAACGSCHGLPPPDHQAKYAGNNQCSACHPLTAPKAGTVAPTFHVDGVVQVGDNTNSCSSCHGNPQNPAPPRDLSGNTSPTALGVGAHQAHLTNAQGLTAPIPCASCHVVPAAVDSPGHIDHPLPATVTFSGLALNDGAAPAWDRNTATCSNTYCHGGGAQMANDTAGRLRTPVWTLGSSQAFCGSCHGVPPSTTAHAGVNPFDFGACARCHANTVTSNGTIIVTGPPGARTSAHINGVIDVTP